MSAKAAQSVVRALDLALAGGAALVGGALLAQRRLRHRSDRAAHPRLLVLNSHYSLGVLRARRAEHLVTHRDLNGYFDHVWSVHPLVGADPADVATPAGPPVLTRLNRAHTVVEGKTGRFPSLFRLPYLNFALAQLHLVLVLDRLVQREGIAILRGDPYYNGLLALMLGRLSGRAVEIRINGNHDTVYETVGSLAHPRLFRWRAVEQRVARYTLSRADSVVVGSADNRAFALRNGARAERLRHAGNTAMINPVHVGEPSERPLNDDEFGFGDRPVVLCVSRLEPLKHPEDVVISVAKARRRNQSIAAVIVGEGVMRSALEKLCADLGVEGDIVLPGDRDQEWIARMLASAAVVAAPLAGLALVESALSGTPIVAYDVEWHSELITHQQECLLVPNRDTDAMAEAICHLIDDRDEAGRLATAARARVLDMMQPERWLSQERGLSDELLAMPGGDVLRLRQTAQRMRHAALSLVAR